MPGWSDGHNKLTCVCLLRSYHLWIGQWCQRKVIASMHHTANANRPVPVFTGVQWWVKKGWGQAGYWLGSVFWCCWFGDSRNIWPTKYLCNFLPVVFLQSGRWIKPSLPGCYNRGDMFWHNSSWDNLLDIEFLILLDRKVILFSVIFDEILVVLCLSYSYYEWSLNVDCHHHNGVCEFVDGEAVTASTYVWWERCSSSGSGRNHRQCRTSLESLWRLSI